MSRISRARSRDRNEPEIVRELEARGCSVTRLNGDGVPDLLVGYRNRTLLVEVKCPLGPRGGLPTRNKTGGLTEDQVTWWGKWRGAPVTIVRTVGDVDALLAGEITVDDVRRYARARRELDQDQGP